MQRQPLLLHLRSLLLLAAAVLRRPVRLRLPLPWRIWRLRFPARHTDVVRATQRHLYQAWLEQAANDPRVQLCGDGKAPLAAMQHWPRDDQVLLSRSRTDTLPELGTYRLRLGLTTNTACRWCGLQPPPQHDAENPEVAQSGSSEEPSQTDHSTAVPGLAANPLPATTSRLS